MVNWSKSSASVEEQVDVVPESSTRGRRGPGGRQKTNHQLEEASALQWPFSPQMRRPRPGVSRSHGEFTPGGA